MYLLLWVCAHVSVEVRGHHQLSFLPILIFSFLRQDFLLYLKLINSARWANQWASGIFLPVLPCWILSNECYHTWPFRIVSGSQSNILILGWQVPIDWTLVLALLFTVLNQKNILPSSPLPLLTRRKLKDHAAKPETTIACAFYLAGAPAPEATGGPLCFVATYICQLAQRRCYGTVSPPSLWDPKVKDHCLPPSCVFPVSFSGCWGLCSFLSPSFHFTLDQTPVSGESTCP